MVNRNTTSILLLTAMMLLLTACEPIKQEPVIEAPTQQTAPRPVEPEFSSEAIVPAPLDDVRFAQHALNQLGFKVGLVDGLWGPRSAKQIRLFESQNQLLSANGHLSELNLHFLALKSGINRENFNKKPEEQPLGINAKLDPKVPLKQGPQLIIVDKEYSVYSKPNPYSSVILKLAAGTGIYVISKQDGYFEVESINRRKGFIKAD